MLGDEEFRELLHFFDRPWSGYRKIRKGVKKRLRRHMDVVGCRNIVDYLKLLQTRPEEKARSEQCLIVTISRFFRDRQLWQFLEERLLDRLIRRFTPPLRFWSAGCAGGEEPYSLAMVWNSLEGSPSLDLLATDSQAACLQRAQAGIYGRSSLKEVPMPFRSAYFVSLRGGRKYLIKKEALPAIGWQQHNLIETPPPGPFHMIMLRNNLLTYYQGSQLAAAVERIFACLAPGGYLITGSHEKPPPSSFKLHRDPSCPWVWEMDGNSHEFSGWKKSYRASSNL